MLNSHRQPSWSAIYKLTSEPRQQRILRVIDRLDHPGITMLGMVRDGEFFVVARCTSALADIRVRRIVISLDLLSERVSPIDNLYESEFPAEAYVSGFDLPRRLAKRLPGARLRKIL